MKTIEPLVTECQLSNLEIMGALTSRLVHDLKNKLAVIAGNAQFGCMLSKDPQRMVTALNNVLRSSEDAARCLEQMASLRRELSQVIPLCPVAELQAAVRAAVELTEGWIMVGTEDEAGMATMPPRWLGFVVRQLLSTCPAAAGEVKVEHLNIAPEDVNQDNLDDPFPGDYLAVEIQFVSREIDRSVPPAEEPINTLAARELVRRSGGILLLRDPRPSGTLWSILLPWRPL
jgi:signal transduction histidine kinase